MKKVIKAPIILQILASSAFSIIGSEPSRAGNTVVEVRGNFRLMKNEKGVFKVKNNKSGQLLYKTSSRKDGKYFMRNEPVCNM